MNLRVVLFASMAFALPTRAAETEAPKYAPGIVGRLTDQGRPLAANVCLRSGGSEIRQCAYADFDGRFYIPTLGAVQPKRPDVEDRPVQGYPEQWLELVPRGAAPTKLYPVGLVDVRTARIRLDCDVTRRSTAADGDRDLCRIAPEPPPAAPRARH